MPTRLLVQGLWRDRRGRHAAVAVVLAAGFLAGLFGLLLLQAAQEAVATPVRDLLAGDARLTTGSPEIAGGQVWSDARPIVQQVQAATGGVAAMRWETTQITARKDHLDNWTAGILVGLDPSVAQEQAGFRSYMVWGNVLPSASLVDPATQRAYVPLVLGQSAALRLGIQAGPGGSPDFAHVLRLTSGRFGNGASAPPIDRDAVVVGVYRTGLESLDRFAAFAPIQDVRFLVGLGEGDPVANAIVVHGASAGAVRALGLGIVSDGSDVARLAVGLAFDVASVAVAAGVVVLVLVLGLLLARESALQVSRDAASLSTLRALGVARPAVVAPYAVLACASALAAALLALGLAGLATLLWPAVAVHANGADVVLRWHLDAANAAWLVPGAILVAAAASLVAARRVGQGSAAASLRRD